MPEGTGTVSVMFPTSSQGGLYGSKEGWQDQEESPCEEESTGQEEEVGSLSEAIH